MRAVDPSVKIGIIAATVRPPDDPWNPAVLRLAGATADFFVVHWYAVGYDASVPQGTLMQACMAAGDQFDIMLGQYHALIRKCVGHDLPIALTEYNCGFVQEKPEPYRYSLGAALFSADLIRVLLKPQNKILFANYWQAVNGYWGMIHGSGDKWTYMPEYPLRRLWGQHFGRTLLATTVYSPTEAFAGAGNTRPASGATYRPRSPLPGNQFSVSQVSPGSSGPVSWTASNGGVLTFDLPAVSGNRYVSFGLFNAPRQTAGVGGRYDCSCDIRAVASAGDAQYSLGTGDARGWDQTHSAVKTPGITADGQWHHVEAIYRTLPDTRSLAVLLRVENSTSPVTAQVAIKNLVITAETAEALPAYPLVTASSSRSANGKTIYVVVFNKSTDKDIACTVNVAHANAISARRWTVTGPSLASTNVDGPAVAETETAISTPMAHSQLTRSFPAHSMTAFEISVR
jgi:alpha-N-arabinofuranosidase